MSKLRLTNISTLTTERTNRIDRFCASFQQLLLIALIIHILLFYFSSYIMYIACVNYNK